MSKSSGGIGYVLRKFPVLSETFILNEILALESAGIAVHIFSLERPNDSRFHEDLAKLKADITYLPTGRRTLWDHNARAAQRYGKRYLKAFGYAIRHINPSLFFRFLQGTYVANHARRLGLTHLHSHFANRPTSVAFFASWLTNIPYSFTAHAADIFRKRVNQKALARKIDRARFVIAISDFNKTYLERLQPESAAKIMRLYNGIDLERFVPNGHLRKDPFTILCVSRLVEKKGIPVLIEACRKLHERKIDFQCFIVGGGRERSQLELLIRQSQVRHSVKLVGPQTHGQVLQWYQSADLYVLPCLVGSDGNRDGLPVSIVEALACGIPVITTPMTGIPEIIQHGQNGLIVPMGDPEALAGAIQNVIESPSLHQNLKSSARRSVEAHFDLRQTSGVLQSLLQANFHEDLLSVR